MIVVYRGTQERINIKLDKETYYYEETYYQGVPMYCPTGILKEVLKNPDFQSYNKNEIYKTNKPIFVRMPFRLEYFIGAIRVLERIKQVYPGTQIIAQCHINYEFMLQGYAKPGTLSLEQQQNCLKIFNLTDSNIKLTVTPYLAMKLSFEQILLQVANLFDVPKDNDLPCLVKWQWKPEKDVLYIGTKNPFIRGFQKEMAFDILDLELTLKEQYEIIRKYKYIIAWGNSEQACIAVNMGIPISLFLADNDKIWMEQYIRFSNTKGRGRKISTAMSNIKNWVDDTIYNIKQVLSNYENKYIGDNNEQISGIHKPTQTEKLSTARRRRPRKRYENN